jgi:hypothetical protein
LVLRSDQDAFIFQTMRSTESKNQNKQLPTQVAADQIQVKINVEDVKYAISKLTAYDDPYSTGIVKVFNAYLEHCDFLKMRDELETVPYPTRPTYKLWDTDAHCWFLEVIYPSDVKGGPAS